MSKLAKMRAALKAALTPEQVAAREAFKSKFEHGYYHGSPSNEIKVFDPSQSDKDLLATPQATFVTKEPAFAESFLPESAHEIVEGSGRYYPFSIGSTIYPVSINKGKHFDFGTPEGQALAKEFIKEKLIPEYGREKAARWLNSAQDELNNWKAMEHPDFLKHLQDTGHDSFAVTEGGIKNVGIFKPENIRGKFAEFDPAEAANPDFMKAEGGQVEGYAPGGKILGGLAKLISGAEREANKAQFLAGNHPEVPEVVYHATRATPKDQAIDQMIGSKYGTLGSGVYTTPNPHFGSMYSGIPTPQTIEELKTSFPAMARPFVKAIEEGDFSGVPMGGYMMPLHPSVKNPLILQGTTVDPAYEALAKLGVPDSRIDSIVEKANEKYGSIGKEIQSRAQKMGHDGVILYKNGDIQEMVTYSPNQLKSALGNEGTFNPYDPRLSKKHGGSI